MLLTEEQEHIRDTAREFAQSSLAPYSAEWESKAVFPRAALRELGKLGFMGMTVPPEWDGAGTDYVAYALALEEVAAGDGAVSTIMSGHNSVGCMPLVEYGTPAQKEKYLRPMARGEMLSAFCLTEPQSGSDAGEIRTRAERRNGAYILNGMKQFVTSGKNADVALVIAATDLALGKRGISCFIVEPNQPGYRVGRIENQDGPAGFRHLRGAIRRTQRTGGKPARRRRPGLSYRARQPGRRPHRHRRAGRRHGARRATRSPSLMRRNAAVSARRSSNIRRLRFAWPTWRPRSKRRGSSCCMPPTCAARACPASNRPRWRNCSPQKPPSASAPTPSRRWAAPVIWPTSGVERIYRAVRGSKIYEGTNDIQRLVISRALVAQSGQERRN